MQTETTFPNTRQDIEKLKQTTVDAAKDLGSTAAVHAQKARGQLGELAGHAKDEAADQLNRAQGTFNDLALATRDYVTARPVTSLAVAFGVGLLVGLSRRSCSK
jgi:ElaB/YqjD/DUF883 family membrane-anchored ribosome-binding protein